MGFHQGEQPPFPFSITFAHAAIFFSLDVFLSAKEKDRLKTRQEDGSGITSYNDVSLFRALY